MYHFSDSFQGVQYDFGVKPIPTVPFKEAPDAVLMSLAQLTDVGKRALECSQRLWRENKCDLVDGSSLMEKYIPYNELLALGYRETDCISVSQANMVDIKVWKANLVEIVARRWRNASKRRDQHSFPRITRHDATALEGEQRADP